MATSKGFGEFSKRMKILASGLATEVENTVKKAAIVADQVAVLATPVDTGRARGGWLASVGTPSDGEGPLDQSGGAALNQAQAVVNTWKAGAGPIFLANNVPYIVKLDNGSSRQAPAGMTAAALQAAGDIIRKAKVVK